MLTLAFIDIKMTDWIVFALQYAFESILFSSLIILVTLGLVLGLLASLWGWLWNKKWSPFKKLSDMFVCVLLALLFSMTSLALHGLSGQNFGMGLKDTGYATYSVPRNGKISNTLFRVSSDPQSQESISKTPEQAGKDEEQVRQHVSLQAAKRWAEAQSDCPKVIRDFLGFALKQDVDLTEACEKYASPNAKRLEKDLSEARKKIDDWEKTLNDHAASIVDSYREAVTFLTAFWYVLMLLMPLYVAWRAYTDIKIGEVTATPSEKALGWAMDSGTVEAPKDQD